MYELEQVGSQNKHSKQLTVCHIYISIESGRLTAEQKKELIERLTATASEVIHIPEQFFTVTIKELPDENFGIGVESIDEIKRNYNP